MPTQGLALAGSGCRAGSRYSCWWFHGLALDRWLGTTPLFRVVLFFIGAAAGMMNVWRAATGRGMAAGYFEEQAVSDDDQHKDRSG